MATKLGDYKTQVHNDWCPGCGDFGIVNAIQMSLTEMQIPRHKAAIWTYESDSGTYYDTKFMAVFFGELENE